MEIDWIGSAIPDGFNKEEHGDPRIRAIACGCGGPRCSLIVVEMPDAFLKGNPEDEVTSFVKLSSVGAIDLARQLLTAALIAHQKYVEGEEAGTSKGTIQ